jgi:hypothetical protein
MIATPITAFNDLFQIGYVTADIQTAMSDFRDHYGVAEFLCYDKAMEMTTPRGTNAVELRLAFAFIKDIQIELIQPLGGDVEIYTDVLNAAHSTVAFHHIAVRVQGDMGQWERCRAAIGTAERPLALEGAVGDDVRFAYSDERERLGHYIEYLWYSPIAAQGLESVPRY